MSKELELIAHALADAADDGCFDNPPTFHEDGLPDLDVDLDGWHSGGEDRVYWMKLAAHVVSVLAASGHTIVPSGTGLVSQLRRLHYERPVSIAGSAWMTGAKSECGHCRREWPCATIAAIAEEDTNGRM